MRKYLPALTKKHVKIVPAVTIQRQGKPTNKVISKMITTEIESFTFRLTSFCIFPGLTFVLVRLGFFAIKRNTTRRSFGTPSARSVNTCCASSLLVLNIVYLTSKHAQDS